MSKLVPQLLDLIESDIDLNVDVDVLYREMERKAYLLRLERLSNILHCIGEGEKIILGLSQDFYANAVIADNDAIKFALAEGEAPGPIRTLIGFGTASFVGFDPSNVSVSDIENNNLDLRCTALRAAFCRHMSGALGRDDIGYVIFPIPRKLFPENRLTENENKSSNPYIFRGSRIDRKTAFH